ncbi:MAG: CsbD family protein [Pseudomonadota bacterium]
MNKLIFNGTWNEVQGKLKQKYGQLTDNDLVYTEGKHKELLGCLKKKLGKKQDDLIKIIAEI